MPIRQYRDQILYCLEKHQVVILVGETGRFVWNSMSFKVMLLTLWFFHISQWQEHPGATVFV